MTTWNDGYVTEVGYTYGYYVELNPNRIAMALLSAGLLPPKINRACELGFGQGASINIHAAANTSQWYGNDFNPSQAGYAQQLSNQVLQNIHIFDDSFSEFNKRDLPKFDFIALHGIWSWISDENRRAIVNFIDKNLSIGGVVYISYNTMPGWSTFAPVRHLISTHGQKMGGDGQRLNDKIGSALEFADKLFQSNPKFLRNNDDAAKRLAKVKDQRHEYLAHEYFNADWTPAYFNEMESAMENAKMTYACSANLLDHIDAINLTQEHREFLGKIPNTSLRETARDFIVNQQFRRDYWVKGPVQINHFEKLERIRSKRFIYSRQRVTSPISVMGALGEAKLLDAIYSPILKVMEDYTIRTFQEIEEALGGASPGSERLTEAILLLCGANILSPAQDENAIALATEPTRALNQVILRQALFDGPVKFLASPVTGGGLHVGNIEKMFVLAIEDGLEGAQSWANYAQKIMASLNQSMLRNGKPIPKDKLMDELVARATEFEAASLPLLRGLKIIDGRATSRAM